MGKLNAGLAAYLAKKNGNMVTPTTPSGVPMMPMHPQMLASIKASPKGKLPAGLQRYLANKKKISTKKKGYNFTKVEKKLGVVNH